MIKDQDYNTPLVRTLAPHLDTSLLERLDHLVCHFGQDGLTGYPVQGIGE